MHRQSDSLLDSLEQPTGASAAAMLHEACLELEQRLRSGEMVRAEELLTRHPVLAEDPEHALDLLYVEYTIRRELGEAPLHSEFLARFPQWHTQLDRQFQLEDLLDEPAPRAEDLGTGPVSPPDAGPARTANGRFRILRLLA